jgi:hypothetical protein
MQCGSFRPDFVWERDIEQRVVLLECDEHAHRVYPAACEFTRPIKIALGYGDRPVHLLRYNPDMLSFVKSMPARKEREQLLLSRMQAALAPAACDDSKFKHILTIEFLYYYDIPGAEATAPHVQTISFATPHAYEVWAEAIIAKFEGDDHREVTLEGGVLPPKHTVVGDMI